MKCRVGDFTLKSGRFHPWNLVDFTQISPVKSTQNYKSKCFSKNSSVWWMQGGGYDQGFHEIHPEIWWISPMKIWWISPRYHLWNPPKIIKASVSAKTFQFDECRVGDFTLEIQWISPWNLVDFTCEIWQISPRFHLWNPSKIIKASVSAKTLWVWWMQGGGFHPKRNLVDFTLKYGGFQTMKSGGFHPDFTCEIHPKL